MLLGKAEKNIAEGREGDPRTQDFPPLSLPAINQVTWSASGGRSQHSQECLTLAMGLKSLRHRVTNFTLPASTLPGLDCLISVTISTHAGGREAKQGLGPTPSLPGKREGRPLIYTKAQAGLASSPEIWSWVNISRDRDCCTASFNSGKSLSIL